MVKRQVGRKRLTQHEIRQIAVGARLDPRTVVAALAGIARDPAVQAVRDAARRLGIELPAVSP